jgi:HPt (histidine-containing phosphotransfer) domain-containing protein
MSENSKPIEVDVDEDLKELIPGYLDKRVADIAQIKTWIEDKSFTYIRELSHKIKGSGGGYGFQKLSEIAAIMEQASKDEEMPVIVESIKNIEHYISNVKVNYVKVD